MGNLTKEKMLPEFNNQQKSKNEVEQEPYRQQLIGTPHLENTYWKMLREGKTKSLSDAFKQNLINCYQVIIPSSGHTILHQSIILDRREIFRLCEVYGANWNQKDVNGVTPLMKAAALNRTYYLEKLIQKGADKEATDKRGFNAYRYAQYYQHYQSMDTLQETQQSSYL